MAKDAEGHHQIRELSSRAWGRSYYSKKLCRVPTYYSDIEEIIGNNPGHVIASTACLGGYLGTSLLKYRDSENQELYYQIINWCKKMNNLFGKDNFYLELQPSFNKEQVYVNSEIFKISEMLDIPYIITTDSHYKCKEDAFVHKAFLNAQDGEREVDSFYATTYLMNTEELESYLSKYLTREQLDYAYSNILKIKNLCEDFSLLKPLKIPSLEWKIPTRVDNIEYYCEKIPYLSTFLHSDFAGDKRLAELVIEKLELDARLRNEETYNEINNNLEATWISSEVNKAHWSAYFLNLQKIIDVCWESGTLVGPGRGSGVGLEIRLN